MTEYTAPAPTPKAVAIRLGVYFFILLSAFVVLIELAPQLLNYLPFGGRDALGGTAGGTSASDFIRSVAGSEENVAQNNQLESVEAVILFVVGHLTGTILVMLPVTWTYTAVNWDIGFRRGFVRALLVLPICATTVVLLIQDSLALAFGLAALVAAVRFRVALDEAMDGIFIFAAICVGLAAGIGYLGVALVMSIFFCFTHVVMWAMEYGRNPNDDARVAKKQAKLQRTEPQNADRVDL